MTLRAKLATLDGNLEAAILLNGMFSPVLTVKHVGDADFVLLRGKDTTRSRRFTVNEQGLVGRLVRLGFDNAQIAEVLDRSVKSVEGARHTLGF